MSKSDLNGVDLNLLKLLHALVEERSVTRAGMRVGLSQPAASRALARLRHLLGDRIVVRTNSGLDLTPRAIALADPVRQVLDEMRAIVAPTSFDPATATGRFRIAAIDRLVASIAPALVTNLASVAPLLDLEFPQPVGDNVDLVVNGKVDLAIGVFTDLPVGLFRRAFDEEDFVCIVRRGHSKLSTALTLEGFAAMSHVTVLVTGRGETPVDVALGQLGFRRRVALRVPHFLAAATIVADSDLILSLPRRLARRLAAWLPIEVLEMPFPVSTFTPAIIWHERRQDDPAHRWLRQQVVAAATIDL